MLLTCEIAGDVYRTRILHETGSKEKCKVLKMEMEPTMVDVVLQMVAKN
jgi:hypothetical protein